MQSARSGEPYACRWAGSSLRTSDVPCAVRARGYLVIVNMDNPAGRLRYWMVERAEPASGGNAILHSWQQILGYEADSWDGTIAVLRHASLLADLCTQVRTEALLLPAELHPKMLLLDFEQVETSVRYFTGMTQHTIGTQLSAIEGTGHRCLQLLDAYLSSHRPQGFLNLDTLDDLLEQVDALLAQVRDHPDLDEETRRFVQVRFREVRQALRDARVAGPRAVERATDALLGSFQREPRLWHKLGESTLAEVVGGLIVALLLSLGTQPTRDMLPPGTPERVIIESHVTVNIDPAEPEGADDEIVEAELVDDLDVLGRDERAPG